ncbi:hypothetical protein Tco_0778780 [Tanacetum coccineum]
MGQDISGACGQLVIKKSVGAGAVTDIEDLHLYYPSTVRICVPDKCHAPNRISKKKKSIAMGCIYTEAKDYPREPAAHVSISLLWKGIRRLKEAS